MRHPLLLLCAVALLPACTEVTTARNSNEVGTEHIYAELSATHGGEGSVVVDAELHDSADDAFLRLTGGDELIASNGLASDEIASVDGGLFGGAAEVSNSVLTMTERHRTAWDTLFIEVTSDPTYHAAFNDADLNRPFYVSFLRAIDSVPDIELKLPSSFEITSPSGARPSHGRTPSR